MSYGNPSPMCYIGSVMRLMEYLGNPIGEDELFALSGVGLCFPWQFNSCCDEVSIIPDIPRRTFEALGYAHPPSRHLGHSLSFTQKSLVGLDHPQLVQTPPRRAENVSKNKDLHETVPYSRPSAHQNFRDNDRYSK